MKVNSAVIWKSTDTIRDQSLQAAASDAGGFGKRHSFGQLANSSML